MKRISNEETYYRVWDLERELSVSRATIYRWCKKGVIEYVKLPSGHIRITMKNGSKHEKKMLVGVEYFNFDMERVIQLAKKVTTETNVSQQKIETAISFIQKLEKQLSIKQLIETLASCP